MTTSTTTGTTIDPVAVTAGYIGTLLLPGEVAALAGGVELTTRYIDLRFMAAKVDPAQVEHMVSFDSLDFVEDADSRSLSLITIEFDSESAATDHLELVTRETPGIQGHSVTIGDASFYVEVNESAFGSMVLFKKGVWVVTLHTAQPDGARPLVDIAAVETLARIVADRL